MDFTASPLPPERDHVVLAVNPKAGARSTRHLVEELASLLRDAGYTAEIKTDLSEISVRTAELHTQGRLRTLVAVGGDGTAAEMANRTQPGTPLTIFPSGTENLLAKYLGMSANPDAVCRIIRDGYVTQFDAGWACSPKAPEEGRLFLLMADFGFDAEVVRLLHDERAGHISRFTYFKPFWQALRRYQHPEMRLFYDEMAEETSKTRANDGSPMSPDGLRSRWLFVFNLPCYATGLKIAPRADGSDGLFDVCSFRGGSGWKVFQYLFGVLFRCHTRFKDCETRRVRRIRIESEQPVPYLLDGDPGGWLPLEIRLLPQHISLLVPKSRVRNESQ